MKVSDIRLTDSDLGFVREFQSLAAAQWPIILGAQKGSNAKS